MAPLQKRALYGLAFGVVWAVAIIMVFIVKGGVSTYSEDTGFRLIMAGLLIGGLLAYLILMNLTLHNENQDRLMNGTN